MPKPIKIKTPVKLPTPSEEIGEIKVSESLYAKITRKITNTPPPDPYKFVKRVTHANLTLTIIDEIDTVKWYDLVHHHSNGKLPYKKDLIITDETGKEHIAMGVFPVAINEDKTQIICAVDMIKPRIGA